MRSIIAVGTLSTLGACAHSPESNPSATTEPETDALAENDPSAQAEGLVERAAALDEQVAADLERLDALQLFDVGELVGGDASEAFHCYGPCEGAEAEVDDYAVRAQQLRDMVDLAESTQAADTECPMDEVDEALASLRGLEIVEVGQFVAEEAAASPYCYNLPCPEDEARAHETNCGRAARVVGLASSR